MLRHHILAGISLIIVVACGLTAYWDMPRENFPEVGPVEVVISTRLAGADALDVEQRVTAVLETAVGKVAGVEHLSSTSRHGVSTLHVRLGWRHGVDPRSLEAVFRQRVRAQLSKLPAAASTPDIHVLRGFGGRPAAMLLAVGNADSAMLWGHAGTVKAAIERRDAVDRVEQLGARTPELQVLFSPNRLLSSGLSPGDLADAIGDHLRSASIGDARVGEQSWRMRLSVAPNSAQTLGSLPLPSGRGDATVASVAEVQRADSEPAEMVRYGDRPAVLLAVYAAAATNRAALARDIDLVAEPFRTAAAADGVELLLIDDAAGVAQASSGQVERFAAGGAALFGLILLLLFRLRAAAKIALSVGFTMSLMLALTHLVGGSVNSLLAAAIVCVFPAIVLVLSVAMQWSSGFARDGPVAAAWAVARPLLLPALLVTGVLYLAVLVQARDELSHQALPLAIGFLMFGTVLAGTWLVLSNSLRGAERSGVDSPGETLPMRPAVAQAVRKVASRIAITAIRRRAHVIGLALAVVLATLFAALHQSGTLETLKTPSRHFYLGVEMPAGTLLQKTLDNANAVKHELIKTFGREALPEIITTAGFRFDQAGLLRGDNHAQLLLGFSAAVLAQRSLAGVVEATTSAVERVPSVQRIDLAGGQALAAATSTLTVRVSDQRQQLVNEAAQIMTQVTEEAPGVQRVADDRVYAKPELALQLRPEALARFDLEPGELARDLTLLLDGEVVAIIDDGGRSLGVRVKSQPIGAREVIDYLKVPVSTGGGGSARLSEFVVARAKHDNQTIHHYNGQRTVSLTATLTSDSQPGRVVGHLRRAWADQYAQSYPSVRIDFGAGGREPMVSRGDVTVGAAVLGILYLLLAGRFGSFALPPIVLLVAVVAGSTPITLAALRGAQLRPELLLVCAALAALAATIAMFVVTPRHSAGETLQRGVRLLVTSGRSISAPLVAALLASCAALLPLTSVFNGEQRLLGYLSGWALASLPFSVLIAFALTISLRSVFKPLSTASPVALQALKPVSRPAPWSGVFGPVAALASPRWVKQQKDIAPIAENRELRQRYNDAVAEIRRGNHEVAIRWLDDLSTDHKNVGVLFVSTAHALAAYMRDEFGYDEGYDQRARRHLRRARRLGTDPGYIDRVELALSKLEREHEGHRVAA